MHFTHSETSDEGPVVEVGEPYRGESTGEVHGPSLNFWPAGQRGGLLLLLSVEEAKAAVAELQRGIGEAEALFPG